MNWIQTYMCSVIPFFYLVVTQGFFAFIETSEDPETCENDNLMGALGRGVIASDNFYFDYRNSTTSSNHRRCIHRIYMNYKDSSKNRTICFRFRRFELEHSEGCFNDYLQFPDNHFYKTYPDHKKATIKFCGNGTWNRGNEVLPIANVFSPEFCWPAESSTFDIVFQADARISGRGYFAEFVIHDTVVQTGVDQFDTPSGFCDFDPTECTQYCYHGHVEIDGCKTCDCIEGAIAPCFPDKYTCFNRKCVPRQGLCDHVKDCGDGSDENYLHARCPGSQGLEACHFDDNLSAWCGYIVESGWLRDNTSPYGPRYDHTYGSTSGHFMYTEAYVEGQAVLSYTDQISKDTDHCYSFWYFMTGNVGTLLVEVLQANKQQPIQLWRRDGNYNPVWLRAEIDLPVDIFPITKIIIRGNDTTGANHNIAIDDLTFVQGECWGGDLSCQFEVGFCKWRNDFDRGQKSWIRHAGPIKKWNTGPAGDRSELQTGYYLYLNSTLVQPGTQGVLISRPVSNGADISWHCITFWYHMYGSGMGQLKISALLNDNTTVRDIWNMTGDQGHSWHNAVISFNGIPGPFQILVNGTVGHSTSSDFAVDEIIYTSGHCPLKSDPPQHGTTVRTTGPPNTCAPGYWTCEDGSCIKEDWVCDGRFDCGDRSDETNCKDNPAFSVGVIVGISIALVFLLLVVGLAVFFVHRKQKFRRPPVQSDSHFDLMHSSPGVDQPPPYVSAIDNLAYSGPSSQLPSYNTVTKKLPPYSPDVDTSATKTYGGQKSKKDNKALVGFGALGAPAGVMTTAGVSPPTRSISMVPSTLHTNVCRQTGYPGRSLPYSLDPGTPSGGLGQHNTMSVRVHHPSEPPPAYGETPC